MSRTEAYNTRQLRFEQLKALKAERERQTPMTLVIVTAMSVGVAIGTAITASL